MTNLDEPVAVATLDTMPEREAAELLCACCGASRWVDGMLARRPFGDLGTLLRTADDVWGSLGPPDWREAFDHHPRLGEKQAAVAQHAQARQWSSREQSSLDHVDEAVRRELTRANAAYEARFGWICIICATGKSPDQLLALTTQRLDNAPDAELRVAAEEQRKITRLRLQKLVHDTRGAHSS